MPQYEAVSSSNVDSIAYKDGDLYVKFLNGSEYKYFSVPFEQFEALRDAPSVGKYLNSDIKPNFQVERLA